MKKLILFMFFLLIGFAGISQSIFPKGVKIGKVKTGTSVITVDSLRQFSTDQYQLYKGSTLLQPYIPPGFKIGTVAVPSTLTATELGYSDGVTSDIQTQLNDKVNLSDSVEGYTAAEVDSVVLAKGDSIKATINTGYSNSQIDSLHKTIVGADSIKVVNNRVEVYLPDRYYRIAIQDSTALPSSLATGILNVWHLNEASGAVLDTLGVTNGTNSGAVPNTAAKFNVGYLFDTNTDYLQFIMGANAPTNINHTFSLWIKCSTLPSVGGSSQSVLTEVNSSYTNIFTVQINTGNTLVLTSRNTDNTSFAYYSASGVIALADTWYHVVIELPDVGESGKIYVNGVRSGNTVANITGTARVSNGRLYGGNSSAGGTSAFVGTMDELNLWNRWLTDDEITSLYNAGAGKLYPYLSF